MSSEQFQNINELIYGAGAVIALLAILVIYLLVTVSSLKTRYNKMMKGTETGADFEKMMLSHIEETRAVAAENRDIKDDNKAIHELLAKAITRVSVIRFNAFADTGSDLSYAVALLDSHDNGVVLSSIFAREDSRSYVKPIEGGFSSYKLTAEEEQALREAKDTARR